MYINLLCDGAIVFISFVLGLVGQHFADEINNHKAAIVTFIVVFTMPTVANLVLVFATLATLQWWITPALTGMAWVMS